MGLHHPLDGATNLKYKLLYFLTPNKKIQKERHQLLTGIDAAILWSVYGWFSSIEQRMVHNSS
jgi:hypothetical protein